MARRNPNRREDSVDDDDDGDGGFLSGLPGPNPDLAQFQPSPDVVAQALPTAPTDPPENQDEEAAEAEQLREEVSAADESGGLLARIGSRGQLAVDQTLDRPDVNVQENVQDILIAGARRSEQVAPLADAEDSNVGTAGEEITEEDREQLARDIQSFTKQTGEDLAGGGDQIAEATGAEGTPVGRFGRGAGNVAAGLTQVFVEEPVTTGFELFTGIEPTPGREVPVPSEIGGPIALGVAAAQERDPSFITDAEKRSAVLSEVEDVGPGEIEATGGTESRPTTLEVVGDFLPAAGGLTARSLRSGSAATRSAGEAADVGTSLSAGEEASQQAAESATMSGLLRGIGRAVRTGGRATDEATQAGEEGAAVASDLPVPARDAPGALTDESLPVVDEQARVGDDATEITDTGVEEAIPEGTVDEAFAGRASGDAALPVPVTVEEAAEGAGRAIEDVIPAGQGSNTGAFDEAFEGASRGGDEADPLEELFGVVDETVESVDESTSVADESVSTFDDAQRTVNDVGQASDEARFADDLTTTVDEVGETTRIGEDFARSTDEASRVSDDADAGGLLDGVLGGIRSNPLAAGVGGAILGGGLLAALGRGGDGRYGTGSPGGAASSGAYTWESVDSLSHRNISGQAYIFELRLGDNVQGYFVPVAANPVEMLTRNGGTRQSSITWQQIKNGTEEGGPRPRADFDSQSQARQAFETWASELGGQQSDRAQSEQYSGSLDAPDDVEFGQGFSVDATLQNETSSSQSGRFVLGINTSRGFGRLDSQRQSFSPNEELSVRFEVSSTTSRLRPGDYTLVLIEADQGTRIASSGVSVVEAGESGDGSGDSPTERSEWGEVERVRELGAGWFLFRQQHKSEQKVRWMVAGRRSDGTTIYLYPGGQVREDSPHFFQSRESAIEAFQTWRQRNRNGNTSDDETPSTAASSPTAQGVRRQSAEKDTSGLGAVTSFARENPAAAGVILLGVGVGIWYLSDGQPIQWIQDKLGAFGNAVEDTVESVIP